MTMTAITTTGPRRLAAATACLLTMAICSTARAEEPARMGIGQPVASAMRQIVPPGHVVTFGPGVSPQTHVDWHDDGDWQRTMRQSLATRGLRPIERGNAIEIVSDAPAAKLPNRARPNRRAMEGRRTTTRESPPDEANLEPEPIDGMPQLMPLQRATTPRTAALPYPNAPAGTSAPSAPMIPPPTYAPPQSYLVPPSAAGPTGPIALRRPVAPNYDPPADTDRYQVAGRWHADANSYLDDVINRWCSQAGGGWALTRQKPSCIDVKTDLRYRLTNPITLAEPFETAVITLVNAIHAPIAPYVRVHARSHIIELTDSEHLSQSADE